MKQRIFKQKWLFLVLAVLLLIPAGFTLAKYAETRNVGTVTLDIQANSNSPTVLAGDFLNDYLSWQYQLGFYPTALVFDSYDNHAATLGMTWGQGKNVGEADEDGNFTDGVKLFKKDTTAYILAKGSNSVTFPRNSTYLLASPDSSDNIMQDVTSITFGSIDTSNTKIMMSMFYDCSALKELDLSKFNTANVTSMQYMFHGCKALETLDLSSFNTENLKNIKAMFQSCTALKTLNISSFNTEKVTNMSYMFNGCSNLEQLDLSSFNTQKVTDMYNMFASCSKLEQVTLGTNFKFFGTDGYLPEQTDSNIPGANGLWYTDQASYYTPEQAAEHQKTVGEATTYYAVGVKAPDAPAKVLAPSWKNQLGNSTPTALVMDSYDNQAHIIKTLSMDWETGGKNVGEQEDCVKLFMDTNSNTAYVLAKGSCPVTFPVNSSNLFMTRRNLETIQFNRINTSQVTNMVGMFLACTKLTSLDLTGFDTRQVTDMHYMFMGCQELTSLNVTSFDTGNVTDMAAMFRGCSKLTALDVTGFDTGNVRQVYSMFDICSSLKQLDLSSFNTQKVTDMAYMFASCSKLEQVTLGTNFKFVGTNGYLPTPSSSDIPGADGKWYIDKENGYAPADVAGLARTEATTYYAVKTEAPEAPSPDTGEGETSIPAGSAGAESDPVTSVEETGSNATGEQTGQGAPGEATDPANAAAT